MNFNKYSIRQLITFLLLALGAVVIALSVVATQQLRGINQTFLKASSSQK